MAKLTKKERDALPDSAFADPKKRRYPITDAEHAKVAAGLAEMHGEGKTVKTAIKKKAAKKGVKVK